MKIFVFQDIEQNIPSFPQKTVWFVLFFCDANSVLPCIECLDSPELLLEFEMLASNFSWNTHLGLIAVP